LMHNFGTIAAVLKSIKQNQARWLRPSPYILQYQPQ
jgi:hypothetical protein